MGPYDIEHFSYHGVFYRNFPSSFVSTEFPTDNQ